MAQKQLGCFKIQAAPQDVHLVSVASSPDADSQSGRFFKLVCERHLVYCKTSGKGKKEKQKKKMRLLL
jgi:hypothetical protein